MKNILVIASVSRARSIWEQIPFVRTGRSVSQDQAFNGRVDFYDLMIGSSWKATKLSWPNGHTCPFDLNNNSPLKYQKTFITFLMSMRQWISPSLLCIEIANLQTI